MSQGELAGDGSSVEDSRPTVTISRAGAERYRYVCPNGHIDWDRTNAHIWCRSCRQQNENGDDVTPEHWEIHDKKHDRNVHWSRVRVVDG